MSQFFEVELQQYRATVEDAPYNDEKDCEMYRIKRYEKTGKEWKLVRVTKTSDMNASMSLAMRWTVIGK